MIMVLSHQQDLRIREEGTKGGWLRWERITVSPISKGGYLSIKWSI